MSLITFDVKYKNKTDNESIRLIPDSELQQLKLMICGKYKIYDLSNLYIYYKGNLITENDITKIKDIFKMKKVKIEISENPIIKKKESFKYFCKCKSGATYICDKCDEFLCELCLGKKKHINHTNKLIKIAKETAQCQQRQATCQSVNTIDEIDGIVNKDNDEDGQRHTNQIRQLIDAEKPVEVVDV